jgi:hypothetical protein
MNQERTLEEITEEVLEELLSSPNVLDTMKDLHREIVIYGGIRSSREDLIKALGLDIAAEETLTLPKKEDLK